MYSKEMKILIVDDMLTMRKYVQKKFEKLGFSHFLEAENGKVALDLLVEMAEEIALVATDINMPEMTGIEFIKGARQFESLKNTPFIVISAEREQKSQHDAINAGANGYLCKPFDEESLKTELEHVFVKKTTLENRKVFKNKQDITVLNNLDALFNPISDSINRAISQQCGLLLKSGVFYKKAFGETWIPRGHCQIVSNAYLADGNQHCSLTLYFDKKVFLKFASVMFEEDFQEIAEDIRDLIAEWLNIALGSLKHELNDKMGCNFVSTIPIIVIGNQLVTGSTKENPLFIFPFNSDIGDFHLLLNLGEERIIPWDNSILDFL